MKKNLEVDFIGYEFLTWFFLVLEKEPSKVLLGTKIVTCLLNNKDQKTSVSSPILEDSYELFASIKNGHLVESLALSISLGETSVNANIHASDFAITQVKIKNNFEENISEDKLSEAEQNREDLFLRMSALDSLEQVLAEFWQKFLALRLHPQNYAVEIANMKKQVAHNLREHLADKSSELV